MDPRILSAASILITTSLYIGCGLASDPSPADRHLESVEAARAAFAAPG